jgi:spermidine synthase
MGRRWLYVASALTGFGVMGAELGVARMVAPFYGTSTFVWSMVIGAVLGSMTLGHLLGGRLSRGAGPGRALLVALGVAALALLLLPLAARPLMGGTLDWFQGGSYGLLGASALGVSALFGAPMVALGTTGPLILHLALDDTAQAGTVGARLYALGAGGSLLGTYLSGLVLIPWLGSTWTVWLLALVLGLLAASGLWLRRAAGKATVAGLIWVALVGGAAWGSQQTEAAEGVLEERETLYNYVRVEESRWRRSLRFNEGYAVQSVLPADGSLYLRDVWGHYAMAPAWTTGGAPSRMLVLGLGGGSVARSWRALYPEAELVGVELDPDVIELGQRYLELPRDIETHAADGRAWLRGQERQFDVILVDAFQFPYIPFHLTTVEFFTELKRRLAPGGVLMINVGRDGNRDQVVHAIARTLSEVFPHLWGAEVRNQSNAILVAAEHPFEEAVGLGALGLPTSARLHLRRLRRLRPWKVQPKAPVLTDDLAPVEWMTDLVLIQHMLGR